MDKHRQILYLGLVLISSLLTQTGVAWSQPYYFYPKSVDERGNLSVFRLNLKTGLSDLFIDDVIRSPEVSWDHTQTWVYVDPGYGRLRVFSSIQPSIKGELPDNEVERVIGVLFVPQRNRFYVTWTPEVGSGIVESAIFDGTNFTRLDTLVLPMGLGGTISEDGTKIYYIEEDSMTDTEYLCTFSSITNSVIDRKNFLDIGPSTETKDAPDGKKGRILIGYNHPTKEHKDNNYFLYDPGMNHSFPIIPFPWRFEGHLSGDANAIILEQVNWDTTRPSAEYRSGNVYIFEAETGKLVQRLSLPSGGKVLVFDNFPNKVYSFNEQTLQAIPVDVTEVTPTNIFLDTLISFKHQSEALSWLGDANFIKELDNHLENARKHLLRSDSTKSGDELQKFQEKVQKEREKTAKEETDNRPRGPRFVTSEGYALLYFNAQYILDRLPKKKTR